MIIAMAGHVDHGKTSLIRTLTGIDPDRLPAEKQRGMTIDLGFAHVRLPNGSLVGFVDVPGHERFLGNMLAGVLSVDTALLVVAADDGPMPQTREHLAVLRLTGVSDLAVAITKIDRVDADRLAVVCHQVRDLLTTAGYPEAVLLPVSSQTGAGMDALRAFLEAKTASQTPRDAIGAFRLSVDRAFVVAGSGLVVTGTVTAGQVSVGDRLVLSSGRLAARVRGIQRHHVASDTAQAGDRCALAIVGPRLERDRIRRGDWLIDPALYQPSRRFDIHAQATEAHTLKHGGRVHVHIGAAAIQGRAATLEGRDLSDGTEDFVHVVLDRPTAPLFGDRVILRDEGSGRVVAGGTVVDPFTPERRIRRDLRLRTLTALRHADPRAAMIDLLDVEGWIDITPLARARNHPRADLTAAAIGLPARLVGTDANPVLLSDTARAGIQASQTSRLAQYHEANPELFGPTKAALLAGFGGPPPDVAEAALRDLIDTGAVVRHGRALALPGHSPALADVDQAAWTRIEPVMMTAGLRAPRVRELAAILGLEPEVMEHQLTRLERFGLLMRVAPNRFFLPSAIAALGAIAETLATEDEAGGFVAGSFAQRSGIGRNLTIQVLEFLDRLGATQRHGEQRFIRRPIAEIVE